MVCKNCKKEMWYGDVVGIETNRDPNTQDKYYFSRVRETWICECGKVCENIYSGAEWDEISNKRSKNLAEEQESWRESWRPKRKNVTITFA